MVGLITLAPLKRYYRVNGADWVFFVATRSGHPHGASLALAHVHPPSGADWPDSSNRGDAYSEPAHHSACVTPSQDAALRTAQHRGAAT
jgi:hypothetical protein